MTRTGTPARAPAPTACTTATVSALGLAAACLLLSACIQPAIIAREPGPDGATTQDAPPDDATGVDDTGTPDDGGADAVPGMDAARPDVPVTPDVPAVDAPDASGTRSLVVAGEIEASSTTSNALTADDYRTHFEIEVSRRGVAILDATVVVTSSAGAVTLTLSTSEPGHYVGAQAGYLANYTIDVTAGADAVHGARLSGPPSHVFVVPRTGEHHRIATPLTVQWSPGGASDAVLATTMFPSTRVADTGMYTIPASALAGTPGALRDDAVGLVRAASVPVTGGAVGSFVRVSVSNSVSFVLDGT